MMAAARSDGFRWASSAAAVYSMAITSSAGQQAPAPSPSTSCREDVSGPLGAGSPGLAVEKGVAVGAGPVCGDKFAPRFDGLRFIETLVTAHR